MLRAVLEVAGEQGYDRVAVRDVLERSGAGRRTFYRHFEDKEACYLAAYAAAMGRVIEHLRSAAEEESAGAARVRAMLVELARWCEREPAMTRALLVDVHAVGRRAIELRVRALREVAALIDPHDGAPGARIVSEGMVGAIDSALHARLRRGRRVELDGLVEELTAFAALLLAPSGAADDERSPRRAPAPLPA